jgi:hypothetical protein
MSFRAAILLFSIHLPFALENLPTHPLACAPFVHRENRMTHALFTQTRTDKGETEE